MFEHFCAKFEHRSIYQSQTWIWLLFGVTERRSKLSSVKIFNGFKRTINNLGNKGSFYSTFIWVNYANVLKWNSSCRNQCKVYVCVCAIVSCHFSTQKQEDCVRSALPFATFHNEFWLIFGWTYAFSALLYIVSCEHWICDKLCKPFSPL